MTPIIIGLTIFLIACLWKREWGIYLIILGLPAYQIRFQVFGVPMTFLEGMIILLAAILSLRGVLKDDEAISIRTRLLHFIRKDKWTLIFILLFLLAAGISVFIGPDLTKAAGIFKAYFAEAVLFYFLVRLIIDSREKFETLLQVMTLLVLYLSVFGIYQYLTLQNLPPSWWDVGFDERRIVSLLNHPNGLALLLGPILALLIIRAEKTKLAWTAIIFGLPAFYLTFSRAGWLALATTVVIFYFIKFKNNTPSPPLKLRGGWGALSISLVLILLVLAIPISRNKLLSLAHADPSKENRYVLWSAAADILKQHPIAGVGLMGFREAYKNYPLGPDRVVQNYPHNFFLTFWVEIGLLGLLSIIGLLVIFYKKIRDLSRTEYRDYALAAGAAMAMIIIHSLVDVSYFKNDLSILFWLVFALPYLTALEPSQSKQTL